MSNVKYEIVFVGGIPHAIPVDQGKTWDEVKAEMISFYEDYVAYWKNQNEPKYYDLDR